MKLPVVPSKESSETWYEKGLDFTCTTCGNCCTGGPGFVFVTDREIELAAGHLGISPEELRAKYCRKVGSRISFKEVRRAGDLHDCIFLTEVPPKTNRKTLEAGEAVPLARRVCAIYPVRPLQCRTWPFWPENMITKAAWDRAAKGCPGMNRDGRHFTREQADKIRDSAEWPANPPTSGGSTVIKPDRS